MRGDSGVGSACIIRGYDQDIQSFMGAWALAWRSPGLHCGGVLLGGVEVMASWVTGGV